MTHRGPFQPLLFCDSVIFLQVEDQDLCLGVDQITPLHLTGAQIHTYTCCSCKVKNERESA